MPLSLYNSLTKKPESIERASDEVVKIYSCGPTVYDFVHIGNLSAFIAADVLRRVIEAHGFRTQHVMNFTDVDDKTIRRSHQQSPDEDPMTALSKLTETYSAAFLADMNSIGNDTESLSFIKATDPEVIEGMKTLIGQLVESGFAYVAGDGVYFSIEAYKKSGKTYGQLVDITSLDTAGEQRIQNDDYDKETAHDFSLWKTQKAGEPAWPFAIDGKDLTGRPGWHIECSVMSRQTLGQPFDIHTGGIDLKFPHHENEIAQSTAGRDNPTYAGLFFHNEHILVDGKKMSKRLNNFMTLKDLQEKSIDPLAFRMLVLQSHYRRATNFSFESVESAGNRLRKWRTIAALRHQTHDRLQNGSDMLAADTTKDLLAASGALVEALGNDLDTPTALMLIDAAFAKIEAVDITRLHGDSLRQLIATIDQTLGLQLAAATPDISDELKQLIIERTRARENGDWQTSDIIRDQLLEAGITLSDGRQSTIWQYS